MSAAYQPGHYRPDVDGLRAIAILTVVLFHAGVPGFAGGFTGVDVFFVISGYLITGNLLDEVQRTGRLSLSHFFARRVRRLMPALFLVVVVTLALSAWLILPDDLRLVARTAQAVTTLSANFFLMRNTGGYFDLQSDLLPLLHTWSLAVEEQYYIVWPLLLLGLLAVGRRCGLAGRGGRPVVGLLLVVLVLSFIGNLLASRQAPEFAFYATPVRAWEFALGGLAQCLHQRPGPWVARLAPGLAPLGVVLMALATHAYQDSIPFPDSFVLLPVVGAALLLFFAPALKPGHPLLVALGSRPMVTIGRLSYSWYLWHWPLLALGRHHHLGQRHFVTDLALAGLGLILAALTYRFVENPIRLHRPGPFKTVRSTLFTGLAASLLVLAGAAALASHAKREAVRLEAASGTTAPARPTPVLPALLPAGSRLLLWGDSHAGRLADNLPGDSAAQQLLVRWTSSCPPLFGAVPYGRGRVPLVCIDANQRLADELPDLMRQGVRGVIVVARWNAYLAQGSTDFDRNTSFGLIPVPDQRPPADGRFTPVQEPDRQRSGDVLRTALKTTVDRLTAQGLRVLLLAPTPELTFHGPKCWAYRQSESACRMARAQVDERRRLALSALQALAADNPAVRLVDAVDRYCDVQFCRAVQGGQPLYTDGNHLSSLGEDALLKTLEPHFPWLGGLDDAAAAPR